MSSHHLLEHKNTTFLQKNFHDLDSAESGKVHQDGSVCQTSELYQDIKLSAMCPKSVIFAKTMDITFGKICISVCALPIS